MWSSYAPEGTQFSRKEAGESMKPLQLILSRIVLIVLLFSMGTPSIAEQVGRASYPPSNCHALKRTSISKAENTPNPELYAAYKEAEKWDILCIGRTVVIDSALESNGGDIFIYADELTLKAPIDTRSRRTNTEVIYKQQWDAVYPLALAVVRDYNIRSIADQNRDYAQYEFPPGESQFPLADCETAAHPERSREKLSGEPPQLGGRIIFPPAMSIFSPIPSWSRNRPSSKCTRAIRSFAG